MQPRELASCATAVALTVARRTPKMRIKKVGASCWTCTSTNVAEFIFVLKGGSTGGLCGLTIIPLTPFSKPFDFESFKAAARKLPPFSSEAPAIAALSAAVCKRRFVYRKYPISIARPSTAMRTTRLTVTSTSA